MPGRWGTSQWLRTPLVSILAVSYNDEILTPARPQHHTAGGKPRNRNPLRNAGSASPYNPCNRGIIPRRWKREAVRVRSSALLFSCKSCKNRKAPGRIIEGLAAVANPKPHPSPLRLHDPSRVSSASTYRGLTGCWRAPSGIGPSSGAHRDRVTGWRTCGEGRASVCFDSAVMLAEPASDLLGDLHFPAAERPPSISGRRTACSTRAA